MHYASLVFEGLRVYNTKIFKLKEHTDRLFNSAKILDMKIPYSYDEIIEATEKLVSDQNIHSQEFERPKLVQVEFLPFVH